MAFHFGSRKIKYFRRLMLCAFHLISVIYRQHSQFDTAHVFVRNFKLLAETFSIFEHRIARREKK